MSTSTSIVHSLPVNIDADGALLEVPKSFMEAGKPKIADVGEVERDTERLALMLEKFKASAARHEEIRKNTHWESSRTPITRNNVNNLIISDNPKANIQVRRAEGFIPRSTLLGNVDYAKKPQQQWFHVKGALAKHHSKSLKITKRHSSKSSESKLTFNDSSVSTDCDGRSSNDINSENINTNSEVEIDVTLSQAGDLREAVSKRGVGTGPQTPRKSNTESPNITFSPHITYAERLLLEKNRRNELFEVKKKETKIEDFDGTYLSDAQEEIMGDWMAQEEPDIEMLHWLSRISLEEIRSTSDLDYLPSEVSPSDATASTSTRRHPEYDIKEVKPAQIIVNGDNKLAAEWTLEGLNPDLDAQKTLDIMEEQIKELIEYNERNEDCGI
ncbi:hypothetical protein Aperf_G00000093656 [Anoplocephala perfoliata]